ncbi:DNRLRE domain-containing protein [Nocardioides sp. W3-2-3]|nr:DNRLRE domain-containing protein [Nocardioides convexus]
MWNFESGSCNAGAIRASRITEAWNSTNVTWSNQPVATATDQVQYSPAHGASGCAAAEAQWNVTNIVQSWANGTPNYGLRMAAYTETNSNTWRLYYSADSSGGTARPKLVVTYNRYPTTSLPVGHAVDGLGGGQRWCDESTSPRPAHPRCRRRARTPTAAGQDPDARLRGPGHLLPGARRLLDALGGTGHDVVVHDADPAQRHHGVLAGQGSRLRGCVGWRFSRRRRWLDVMASDQRRGDYSGATGHRLPHAVLERLVG